MTPAKTKAACSSVPLETLVSGERCNGCDFKWMRKPGADELHCYMFRDEPEWFCAKHTQLNFHMKTLGNWLRY